MAQFLPLTVTDIHHTIRDAVVLTLQPQDPDAFAFTQGQYLTFKQDFDCRFVEFQHVYGYDAGFPRTSAFLQIASPALLSIESDITARLGIFANERHH